MRIQTATNFDVRMKPKIQIIGPNADLGLDSGEWRQGKCGAAFAQQLHGTVIVSLHVSHPDGESFGHAGVGVNREKERAGDRTVRS